MNERFNEQENNFDCILREVWKNLNSASVVAAHIRKKIQTKLALLGQNVCSPYFPMNCAHFTAELRDECWSQRLPVMFGQRMMYKYPSDTAYVGLGCPGDVTRCWIWQTVTKIGLSHNTSPIEVAILRVLAALRRQSSLTDRAIPCCHQSLSPIFPADHPCLFRICCISALYSSRADVLFVQMSS